MAANDSGLDSGLFGKITEAVSLDSELPTI